jgi:hypothetical protein
MFGDFREDLWGTGDEEKYSPVSGIRDEDGNKLRSEEVSSAHSLPR